MTDVNAGDAAALVAALQAQLGRRAVITERNAQQRFTKGMMFSEGTDVAAVVVPDTLLRLWQVLQCCDRFAAIVLAQAANTSLTGGSTPYGQYDAPVVLISMQRLTGIQLLNDGEEVVALPGASLQALEQMLKPYAREPHSVLGSSCVGASIIGGICNNSGGALVQRGPAYTEMALFARRGQDGRFELVNHLGIELGEDAETILTTLEQRRYAATDVRSSASQRIANDDYAARVRAVDDPVPARFNNDPRGLFEASGSSGKVIVFAVRVASFPRPQKTQVYYVSCDDAQCLTDLRREMLGGAMPLPVMAEYMHRDYNEITLKYGRDSCLMMRKLSAVTMTSLYGWRRRLDAILPRKAGMTTLPDKIMQGLSRLLPAALPTTVRTQSLAWQHHLTIKMADDGIAAMNAFLPQFFAQRRGAFHVCQGNEGDKLFSFRFAATAAMLRYYALHEKEYGGLISTDIALPRNARDWAESLPDNLRQRVKKTLYLGHFFCHVFHQDYFITPDADEDEVKSALLDFYDQRGIEYPAEHNVGHLYRAKPALAAFYRHLDPTNTLNPGIGKTCRHQYWNDQEGDRE